jgi:hypothetical protein
MRLQCFVGLGQADAAEGVGEMLGEVLAVRRQQAGAAFAG